MKRTSYIFLVLLTFLYSASLFAESEKKKITAKKQQQGVEAWHVDERFASKDSADLKRDTSLYEFQTSTTPIYQQTIAAEWLGNNASPGQSAIMEERHQTKLMGDMLFKNNYLFYYRGVEELNFYDTKTPYSNLNYSTGFYNDHDEDIIGGNFTVNANEKLNFGLDVNYIHATGAYFNQSADAFTGSFNGSYEGERYGLSFAAGVNRFKQLENGGIINDETLENVEDTYDIPVNMNNATSSFNNYYLWLQQQYSLGITTIDPNDSEKETYKPVITFSYAVKYENNQKRYYEKTANSSYYTNNYYSDTNSRDTASNHFVQNVLSITLNEGFKKWAVFNLRAFAEVNVDKNMHLVADSVYGYDTETLISVGGELFNRKGAIGYGVLANFVLLGRKQQPAFSVEGDLYTQFDIGNEKMFIKASADLRSVNPSYFTESYYSNHFQWNNNFQNIWSSKAYGEIGIPNKYCNFSIGAGWQGFQNYVYFNKEALPTQSNDFIQVINANMKLNLTAWKFHLDNTMSVQYTAQDDVLPLPLFSIYSNLYFEHTFKDIIKLQVGADCRYNTAYYANAYMPATGQFYLQDETLVGNYPLMNVYANFHLKRFRFFFMFYNLSQTFMPAEYFTTPHYALNPGMIKLGLTWSFYD